MTGSPDGASVFVLTGPPGAGVLGREVVARVAAALDPAYRITQRCLGEGEAYELTGAPCDAEARARLRAHAQAALAGMPVDVNVLAGEPGRRRKRLLVADMDSTIIEQECIDEMADMLGLKPRIAAITERAMRGELDFAAALTERVALLKGLAARELERVIAERITLMAGARTLVATMRAHGAFTALVSGGFTFFTTRVRAMAGFDADHANTLVLDGAGRVAAVAAPILGREAKLATLERHRAALGLAREDTLAIGDGANDLAMIGAAGLGVAYRAKPVVADAAAARIAHGDLTAVLYLQGYCRHEFIAGRA